MRRGTFARVANTMAASRRVVRPAPRLLAAGFGLIALVTASLVVSTRSTQAEVGWSIEPINPVVSWADPFGGSVLYDSGVDVEGIYDEGVLELSIRSTPDADGFLTWMIDLRAPSSWFTRPRAADTSRRQDARVWFDVTSSMGCNNLVGRIDVHDVGLDDAGRVTRMWFDWRADCDSLPVHGYVRWGYPSPSVQPTDYAWAPVPVGRHDQGVWFRGPRAAVAPRIVGRDAEDFPFASDLECAPRSCRVAVYFQPTASGRRQATLVYTTASGSEVRIPLEGIGMPGVMRLDVNGETFTAADSGFEASIWTGGPYGEAAVYADDDRGYRLTLGDSYPGQQPFVPGKTYVDGGTTGTDIDVAHKQGPSYPWITCGNNDSTGQFTFRQLFYPPNQFPAYLVDFQVDCGSTHYTGTWRYGARADVTDPARVTNLRRPRPSVLAWRAPAAAVETVVRARRGGVPSVEVHEGELIYAGHGSSVVLPIPYRGKATSYSVFTIDAAGNVSAPRVLMTRGRHRLSLSTSRRLVAPGGSVQLHGRLFDAGWGYPTLNQKVVLQTRVPGGRWVVAKRTTTRTLGRYAFYVRPSRTREYRVRVVATSTYYAAMSPRRKVSVR